MVKKIILWILVLLWMGLIYFFSSFNGFDSQEQSRGFLYHTLGNIIEFFDKDITEIKKEELIIKYDPVVRKIAHLSIFFVLGVLVFSLLKQYNLDNRKLLFYSFLICLLYSISDEVHQLFVSDRSGQILDVFVDTFGSSLGICLMVLFKRRKV